jgi:hypothetical protein
MGAPGHTRDEPAERSVQAWAGVQRTAVDRVHSRAAEQQACEGRRERDQGEPGKRLPGRGVPARSQRGERQDGEWRRAARGDGGIRRRDRGERQARSRAGEGREAPFPCEVTRSEGVFHPVATWYAGLNASFDGMEER